MFLVSVCHQKLQVKESKSDAELLAANLGINFAEASIKDMVETTNNCLQSLFKTVESKWDCRYKQSFTMDNIQARSRAIFLWGNKQRIRKLSSYCNI